jgi:hypothetical protein
MWRILAFSWREPDRHPGFFETQYTEVIHNGCDRGKLVSDVSPSELWYWDQYETSVLKLSEKIRRSGFEAIKAEEQVLAAWVIFNIMYDSWLARNAQPGYYKLLEMVLRSDLDLGVREKACTTAQRQLAIDSKVADVWSYQLMPLARYGAEWLVKLING